MDLAKRSKCMNCHQSFRADARNAWHQQYCNDAACRTASKAASQLRWFDKPENRDSFRGPEHVARTRAWRQAHPGYGARAASSAATSPSPSPDGADSAVSAGAALQDLVSTQVVDAAVKNDFSVPPKHPSRRLRRRHKIS